MRLRPLEVVGLGDLAVHVLAVHHAHLTEMDIGYFDSHCHLDFPEFEGRLPELRAAMAANGVTHALCISTTIAGFPKVRSIAEAHGNFWCSVGVHPDTEGAEETTQEELVALASHPKVVAIILSLLEHDVAADVLIYLSPEARAEVEGEQGLASHACPATSERRA